MSADALQFLNALFPTMPTDERAILCGFRGDPAVVRASAWRPRPWRPGDSIPLGTVDGNGYVCVSTFRCHADGTWRRRREDFAAAHALMIDDVGTKVSHTAVDTVAPSALVETSPANFQAWYFLAEPLRDRAAFERLVNGFIDGRLLGRDPGMAGFNRVGRLPGFLNGKPQYGGAWRCRLHALDPARRWTPAALVEAFGLKVEPARRLPRHGSLDDAMYHPRELHPAVIRERVDAFKAHVGLLRDLGLIRPGAAPDAAGWVSVWCPWTAEHTGGVDSGAAIRVPHEDNGFYGAFRCHHGHCAGRGWRVLTDWCAEAAAELLEAANARRLD